MTSRRALESVLDRKIPEDVLRTIVVRLRFFERGFEEFSRWGP